MTNLFNDSKAIFGGKKTNKSQTYLINFIKKYLND